MAMFDDPKKELQKLEAQLLKEEEWFNRELEDAKKLSGYAPVKKSQKTSKTAAAKKPMDQTQVYRTGSTTQVRNAANNYGKGAPKSAVRSPEAGTREKPREKSVKGLVILACLETLGIVAVAAYWLMILL